MFQISTPLEKRKPQHALKFLGMDLEGIGTPTFRGRIRPNIQPLPP